MGSRSGRDDVIAGALERATAGAPPPVGFGALGRRNRVIWQFISVIWLTVLVAPMASVLDSSYSVPEKIVLTAAGAGFVVGYVLVLWAVRRPPTRQTVVGITVMAALLAFLAIVDHWSWLNAAAFVSVSVGMRLPTGRAVRAVVGISVATVVLAAAAVGLAMLGSREMRQADLP